MTVERFNIQIAQDVLDDLKYRLDHVRWPDQLENVTWERGTEKGYLQSLVSYWREHYDWRAQEAELNRFSQFCCVVNGINVHFVHERGKGPNPLPIILTHGWPDSFIRYKKVIPLLADPARYGGDQNDAFDVDVLLPPKKWAEQNLSISRWTQMPRGGHFAAMEEPELLAKDIREFYREFRNKE